MPLNVYLVHVAPVSHGSSSPSEAVQRIKARVQAKGLEEDIKRLHEGGYCDDGCVPPEVMVRSGWLG